MYIYIYKYVYVCIYMCVCVYRESEVDSERDINIHKLWILVLILRWFHSRSFWSYALFSTCVYSTRYI